MTGDFEASFREKVDMARAAYIQQHGYALIPNNSATPLTPWVIHLSLRGPTWGSVRVYVVKTDGYKKPKRIMKENRAKLIWNTYVGVTAKCSYRKVLPEIIFLRDFLNSIVQVRAGKCRVTPELMKSAPSPELRQELVEAICLAAV